MSAGDQGACFMSFYAGDGTPVSPAHQEACIQYTLNLLANREIEPTDRSDLIALLYFLDQSIPLSQPGEEPWAN